MRQTLVFQWLIIAAFLFSCTNTADDGPPVFPEGSTESVNLWVQDSMRRYYYWVDQMPSKPDYHLPAKDFFKSLLSPQDRFSFMVNTQDPSSYPRSIRNMYGFDYTVIQLAGGQVVTVIKLVLKNSPAFNAGLERGMIITKVNGKLITADNAEAITSSMKELTVIDLKVGSWKNNAVADEKDITVYYGYSSEQPLLAGIFDKNGKKTAYLYVYDFPDGMTSALYQKFAEFKAAGVQELILDLRYNYGGSVSSAAALCSLIPSGISGNSPFIIFKGNKNGGEVRRTFAQQVAYDPKALDFNTLRTNALGLGKVYILTSNSTASAAEIVVNNLKPYMQVIQVGDVTLGKDMAGFIVEDKRKPKKIPWQIHPVIYKVFNANGSGEYSNGITPQTKVNEFIELPLRPLGDPDETLISSALTDVYVKSVNGHSSSHQVKILYQSDMPGAERKAW
ncbi:peptidase S41 [Chryseobacterium indologenes]|uniref:S41 family peptidase n=1 Tax=Chryseobacterium indologenes TaxID=253 RepID=UPI000BFD3CC7|nr:S41 family peptidase [Chryseobacterium indologenes]ATN04860.1 peptidase S41 [Chryseobacterium indologenes]AYY86388.1 peptidase S41 [Chryseobacterium indologenes]QIX83294.1 peptidase S41 [Chryseobacterium indologenes]UDQ52979.1 peptidase S41 [Chryseobacterium indologenes]